MIYNILLDEVSCVSLYKRRIPVYNRLILLYKSLFLTKHPIYMKNMPKLRISCYNLRGNYILTLPVPKTSTKCACYVLMVLVNTIKYT